MALENQQLEEECDELKLEVESMKAAAHAKKGQMDLERVMTPLRTRSHDMWEDVGFELCQEVLRVFMEPNYTYGFWYAIIRLLNILVALLRFALLWARKPERQAKAPTVTPPDAALLEVQRRRFQALSELSKVRAAATMAKQERDEAEQAGFE